MKGAFYCSMLQVELNFNLRKSIFLNATMAALDSNPKVFLSFAASDKRSADAMRQILESQGVEVLSAETSIRAGAQWLESLRSAMSSASVIFVLIGPRTRESKWVNQEIEMAIQGTPSSPPAALVAVILKEHEDYSRPFYDPDNVPLRIHDHVSRESAILRKWPKDPAEVHRWIEDAIRRRQRFPSPFVNFSTQSALSSFDWDESVDEAAPGNE